MSKYRIPRYVSHPLPKPKLGWKDYKDETPRWKLHKVLDNLEQTVVYSYIDRWLSFSPRQWKAREVSKLHRFLWILSTKAYRRLYKAAQYHYSRVGLQDLYLDDYYIPNDIVMHSGYYPGE